MAAAQYTSSSSFTSVGLVFCQQPLEKRVAVHRAKSKSWL